MSTGIRCRSRSCPAVDLDASAAFYARLGFDVDRFDSRDAFVVAAGNEILHREVADQSDLLHPVSAYLKMPNVDHLHATWRAAGLEVDEPTDRGGCASSG